MTEAQEPTSAPMDTSAQANVNAKESVPVQTSVAPAQPVEQEKMVPQSQVNEIIKARLAKERESVQREQANVQNETNANDNRDMNQNGSVDIEQKVASALENRLQEMQRSQQEQSALNEAKKTLESLTSKIDEAAKKYEDFEEVTKNIPYSSFPGLLTAANSVENSGDVLYHLGKNPSKMRELASSFQLVTDPSTGQMVANPMALVAMEELRQLSESMRNNEIAKQKNHPREPLGQIRPSNVGADSGKSSISELRKKWTV